MLDVARLAQVQFGLALLALLVLLAALAWRNVFGRAPAPDLVLPGWWRSPSLAKIWRTRASRSLDGGLALAALALALLSMSAAGPRGAGIDRGRALHELVQAKYHGELGWDGLYACAWAADRDAERALIGIETLRVIEVGPTPALEPTPAPERDDRGIRPRPRPAEPPADVGGKLIPARASIGVIDCRERFDDQRWAALGADVAAIVATNPEESLAIEFQGFGASATPARLARQRVVFALLPVSGVSVFVLSLLGGLVGVAALCLVARAYGLRVAGLVGIACFVEFGASPVASGATSSGALVVGVVLAGLAATRLERWGLAGALLGFAAVELVWPSVLVLGLLAKLAVEHQAEHPRRRQLTRFAIGVSASAAALLLFSATLPGGLGNWSSWADQVALGRYADGHRQVGLRWLFAPEGNLFAGEPSWVAYPVKAQQLVDRQGWITLSGLLLLAPVLLAVRRLPPVAFTAIAGVTATFTLLSVSASSWGVALPLLVLAAGAIGAEHPDSRLLVGRPATVLAAGGFAICVGMHGLVRIHHSPSFLFNVVYSHLLTTLLLGLAIALILLPGLREHGDPPGAPASIPALDPATQAHPNFPWLAKLRSQRGAKS